MTRRTILLFSGILAMCALLLSPPVTEAAPAACRIQQLSVCDRWCPSDLETYCLNVFPSITAGCVVEDSGCNVYPNQCAANEGCEGMPSWCETTQIQCWFS